MQKVLEGAHSWNVGSCLQQNLQSPREPRRNIRPDSWSWHYVLRRHGKDLLQYPGASYARFAIPAYIVPVLAWTVWQEE